MEVSPLPHKTPFCTQIEVTSPTPISTPDEDMVLDSPAPITRQSRQNSLEPGKPHEFVHLMYTCFIQCANTLIQTKDRCPSQTFLEPYEELHHQCCYDPQHRR
jgi:hypothetical protein